MRAWAYLSLVLLAACNAKPAFILDTEKLEVIDQIELAFNKSLDAEKSAVLAPTREASESFAAETRAANAKVTSDLEKLGKIVASENVPKEVEDFANLEEAWKVSKEIDERLLTLDLAGTNLKAVALTSGEGLLALNNFVDSLSAIAAQTTDPARLRDLSSASVSAFRIQILFPAHIASADEAQMRALEQQIGEQIANVDRVMKELQVDTPEPERAEVEGAASSWQRHGRVNAEVLRLSHENTNVRSSELSINEKRRATEAMRNAIEALDTDIRTSIRATR
jgi:hypothetical protein